MIDYAKYTGVCIDWLRGVVKLQYVDEFVRDLEKIDSRLSWDNFEEWTGGGLLNYSRRFVHREVPSIAFAFNPKEEGSLIAVSEDQDTEKKRNPYILFSLSGDALRYIGDKSLKEICKYLYQNEFVCTRIDYALDIFKGAESIVELFSGALENFMNPQIGETAIKTQIKRVPGNLQIHQYSYPKGETFKNYTLGNHGSDHGMFRLYNKHFECLYGRNKKIGEQLLDGRDYWWRAEIELHNSNWRLWAAESFNNLVLQGFPITSCWANAMDKYFTIIFVKNKSQLNNLSIAVMVPEWEEFIAYLYNNIDFVQLVREKYVSDDAVTLLNWADNMRKPLFVLLCVILDKCPGILDDILARAQYEMWEKSQRRQKQKYSWIFSLLEKDNENALGYILNTNQRGEN